MNCEVPKYIHKDKISIKFDMSVFFSAIHYTNNNIWQSIYYKLTEIMVISGTLKPKNIY